MQCKFRYMWLVWIYGNKHGCYNFHPYTVPVKFIENFCFQRSLAVITVARGNLMSYFQCFFSWMIFTGIGYAVGLASKLWAQGGSALQSSVQGALPEIQPLALLYPILAAKVHLLYTCYWKKLFLSHSHLRTMHHFSKYLKWRQWTILRENIK